MSLSLSFSPTTKSEQPTGQTANELQGSRPLAKRTQGSAGLVAVGLVLPLSQDVVFPAFIRTEEVQVLVIPNLVTLREDVGKRPMMSPFGIRYPSRPHLTALFGFTATPTTYFGPAHSTIF